MKHDVESDTSKGWWRWPLVPVASLVNATLGAMVVATILGMVTGLQDDYSTDGWFHFFIYPLAPCGLFGYLLAATAMYVAPTRKTTAGVVMTAVMVLTLIVFNAFVWIMDGVPRGDAIQALVGSLAAAAAAIIALLPAKEHAEPVW